MVAHEQIIGETLEVVPVKERFFSDFNGTIKSLGAWGGDFIMAATEEDLNSVKSYFLKKNLEVVYSYDDLISAPLEMMSKDSLKMGFSIHLIH